MEYYYKIPIDKVLDRLALGGCIQLHFWFELSDETVGRSVVVSYMVEYEDGSFSSYSDKVKLEGGATLLVIDSRVRDIFNDYAKANKIIFRL